MNRADIVAAYPELIRAAEGPVMDSSCACLMRLARAVHAQGYKVVLTGEGADEALAGYAWFKTQEIRERLTEPVAIFINPAVRSLVLGVDAAANRRTCRLGSGSRASAPLSRMSTT